MVKNILQEYVQQSRKLGKVMRCVLNPTAFSVTLQTTVLHLNALLCLNNNCMCALLRLLTRIT